MCHGLILLWLIMYQTLCFLVLSECFLSHVRKVLIYYLFKYFLSLFFLWDPHNVNVCEFDVVPEIYYTNLILISFHFFSCFPWQLFTPLCLPAYWSILLTHSFSYCLPLMYFSFCCCLLQLLSFFICSNFKKKKLLVTSWSVLPYFFSSFWIIFTIITLDTFLDRLLTSLSFLFFKCLIYYLSEYCSLFCWLLDLCGFFSNCFRFLFSFSWHFFCF